MLQVAARVVSKHSLNVMAGHDDVYALLGSGYTILFGSDPQEAADLAAIAYKVASLSLIPVANAMDGFATSHMLSEALLPEPELLKEFLGDPQGRIPAPTVAQEMLFGAKGRLFELRTYLARHEADIPPSSLALLQAYLSDVGEQIERDNEGHVWEHPCRGDSIAGLLAGRKNARDGISRVQRSVPRRSLGTRGRFLR